jgi:23S rRNA pseudouridine1911/1915/1917 synthase
MAHIGHPVLGDEVYGGSRHPAALRHSSLIDGQCLHAARLELTHPRTQERMTFTAPLPEKTEKLLAILRKAQ